MSDLDLEPIKARLDKAHTEWGSWKAEEDSWDGYSVVIDDRGPGVSIIAEQIGQGGDEGRGDAEFIANAPDDLAALLDEVERLRGQIDVLTSERDSALERNNDLIEQSEKQQSRLSAVENLHRRSTYKSDDPYCETCYQAPYGYAPYPCPTICALEVGE